MQTNEAFQQEASAKRLTSGDSELPARVGALPMHVLEIHANATSDRKQAALAPAARSSKASKRVLVVASGGGHWVELLRLRDAWRGKEVAYVTVQPDYQSQVPGARFYCVRDATRWSRWSLIQMAAQVAWVVLRERPDVVISTGALPGLVALRIGKWLGARTLWIDSIANVESLSLSGQRALRFADLHLTQWPHLENGTGPTYRGAVL